MPIKSSPLINVSRKFTVHAVALACSTILFPLHAQATNEAPPTVKESSNIEEFSTANKPSTIKETSKLDQVKATTNRFEKGANIPGQQKNTK